MSKFSPYCIVKATRDGVQALAKRADVQRLDVFVDGEIASPELHDLPERTGPSTSFDQTKLISRHSSVTAYTGTGIHIGMLEEGLPSTNISSHLAGKLSIDRMYTAPGHTPNSDENIHASRVASVLVGSNGVVPGATLYCAATTTLSQALLGAEWLINKGVDVINMSAGTVHEASYWVLADWMEHIVYSHDVFMAAVAGNSYDDITPKTVHSPAVAYNLLGVGAIDGMGTAAQSDDRVTKFSDRVEKVTSGRPVVEKPNLVAPGYYYDPYNGNNVTFSGTSYATPLVAGAAVKLMQADSALLANPETICAMLLAGATNTVQVLDGGGTLVSGGDTAVSGSGYIYNAQGAGTLDVAAANLTLSTEYYRTYNTSAMPVTQNITIGAGFETVLVAIFWLEQGTVSGTHGSNQNASHPALTNLNLTVTDRSTGAVVASSSANNANFEVVEFVRSDTSARSYYTATITRSGSAAASNEQIGLAVWAGTPPTTFW